MLKRIRETRNIILISLLILITDFAIVWLNKQTLEHEFAAQFEQLAQQHYLNYMSTLEQTYASLSGLATYIANDSEIQELFYQAYLAQNTNPRNETRLAEVRQLLNAELLDGWTNMQGNFYARQLHFHFGPGSTSFLRVHRPQKFGDNMDDVRHTIVHTNTTLEPTQGFETGRVYSGFRSVVPMFYTVPDSGERIHTGALETGASFGSVFSVLTHVLQVNAGVALTQAHVQENMWQEAIASKFKNTYIEDCQCYLEEVTEQQGSHILGAAIKAGIDISIKGGSHINLDDQNFFITHFPLYDFKTINDGSNKPVGTLFFWKNIDSDVAALERTLNMTYFIGIIGFLFIEALFLIGIRTFSRQLEQVIEEQTYALNETNLRLNEAQRMAKTGSWNYNLTKDELIWSPTIFDIFGIPRDTYPITYELFLNVVHPDDRELVNATFHESLAQRKPYEIIHRLQLADGQIKYVLERGESQYDENGEPLKSSGTVTDITEEYLLNEQNRLAQKVFEHASEAIVIANADNEIVDTNPAFTEITGYTRAEVLGKNPSLLKSGKHSDEFYKNLWRALEDKGFWQGEIWNKRKSGEIFPEWMTISEIRNKVGRVEHYIALYIDITERKEYEAQLVNIAHHDQLTGLMNRNFLKEKFDQTRAYADRHQSPFAVLFIDLDGFKQMNDQYGHDAGDEILKVTAKRLQNHLRLTDLCFRLGGDEFLVVYTDVAEIETAQSLAQSLLEAINGPIPFEQNELSVAASIGIRYYHPNETCSTEQLVKDADAAMYHAKQSGRNHVEVFKS